MHKKISAIRIKYFLPLFVILIFSVFILLGEMVLKIRYPELLLGNASSCGAEINMFCSFNPKIGRWHKKNFTHTYAGGLVTTNKNGLRGKELHYENRENKHRILVLGDSVTFGYGVNDGETFCDIIEKGLKHTDVINMGVSGFGTGEEFFY
jgi:hypothetical protein